MKVYKINIVIWIDFHYFHKLYIHRTNIAFLYVLNNQKHLAKKEFIL